MMTAISPFGQSGPGRFRPRPPGQCGGDTKIYLSGPCHHGSVPTLTDLARNLTSLSAPELEWLHSLVSDWQLLADLSFADLILWVPSRAPEGALNSGWVAVAQMRPTTGPTSFPDDVVGSMVPPGGRPGAAPGGAGGARVVSRRRGGRDGPAGRAAGARHGAGRAAHSPGERPRLDVGRPGAGGGHPGHQGRPGDRGHRAVDQPDRRASPEPPRADLPGGRRRPVADDLRGHVPLPGARHHAGA